MKILETRVGTDRLVSIHNDLMKAEDADNKDEIMETISKEIFSELEHLPDSELSELSAGVKNGGASFISKLGFVSRAEFRDRMLNCYSCSHAKRLVEKSTGIASVIQCRKCGCLMNVKARFNFGRCPVGKF